MFISSATNQINTEEQPSNVPLLPAAYRSVFLYDEVHRSSKWTPAV
jgi:hypothetical protein